VTTGWFEPLTTASSSDHSSVTLVEGSSFCLSTGVGNMVPGGTFGLYVRDLRIVSQWILEVDGERLEPLSQIQPEPFQATFVTMVKPREGAHESTMVLVREREVGDGMRETLTLRSFSPEAAAVSLELHVGVDFADLFEVKLARTATHHHQHESTADHTSLQFRANRSERATVVHVLTHDSAEAQGTRHISPGRIVWNIIVPARGEWTTTLSVESVIHGVRLAPEPHDPSSTETLARARARTWRESTPELETPDDHLERTLRTSAADLGSLRIFDPDHPTRAIPAAGAPWFMALFGRDSLLTSWMALPLDPSLALGTVNALAEAQGTVVDPLRDEQPGRILHERRFGWSTTNVRRDDGENLYYGTADATPLFVMIVGEMLRWGIPTDQLVEVLPAVDRALDWITDYGDADGDGFVEYCRATDRGLRNQGWKDSFDGVNFAGGRLAEPPIALCEVQGYVYGAYLARAHIAREQGDDANRERYSDLAADLKRRFNETFWLPDRGWYAVALDADKQPVDALASNMGHCLWTGIVDADKAPAVVERLMSREMFSGWGVRTLATTMGAYNPLGYHNGSVWPHDNAIIAAGMSRYGFTDQARQVASGILDAAAAFGGRLPELFCGFDRAEYASPVPFPTSCSPQAWAAAAPLLLMRSLFRLEPSVSQGEVRVAPILPERFLPLSLSNIIIGGARVSVRTDGSTVDVDGLPTGVRLVTGARTPLTELHRH